MLTRVCEYIWIDGFGGLRSKTRVLHLCTFKSPTLSADMSEQDVAYCAFTMRNGVKWANLPITSTTITIISTIITTAIFITTIVIITIHKSMIATLTLYS